MGKKGGNKRKFRNKNGEGQQGRKKFKGESGFTEWAYEHPIFEAYYRVIRIIISLLLKLFVLNSSAHLRRFILC